MTDTSRIIWLQRQRENDPELAIGANKRLEHMKAYMQAHAADLQQAMHRVKKATSAPRKIDYLRVLADLVVKAFSAVSPCKIHCSHCCNIPLLMTQEEANVIGAEIKRPARTLGRYTMAANPDYTGTPCPFLKEGRCSIYKSRPITCRLHVSLDKDDLLCNLASPTKQPQWDSMMFHTAELEAFTDGMTRQPKLGDIREFFPSANS